SRFGRPEDFKAFVDACHREGIGVILDWVPGHFPRDEHALARFDGTPLYEHADPMRGEHPDWGTLIFDFGRAPVRNFLIGNARYWLEEFHVDGLRVDAVASMLYLDYARREGEWIPNRFGGRENLDAVHFLRSLNESTYRDHPDTQTIAEESTAWPMVSRPVWLGGLGFGLKWNMGWMHDVLDYMRHDPVHRKYHHNQLTFGLLYAWHENFVLPLSHDEVVHGKGALLGKMSGDDWQKFANLRALFGYMYGQAGKKLLFMGGEFGQWAEWHHESSLEWHLLDYEPHQGLQRWVQDLNRLYRGEPALHEYDCDPAGFEWVDANDAQQSVVSFLRRGRTTGDLFLVVCNFTPVPRSGYRLGVPRGGLWREALNSDAELYGGGGWGNWGGLEAEPVASHGHPWSVVVTLPALSALFFKNEG
ncbi:MAG: 1,4-alpha-glucan branching enzyme, partial [Candidatus Acidiferrales bacterium]